MIGIHVKGMEIRIRKGCDPLAETVKFDLVDFL